MDGIEQKRKAIERAAQRATGLPRDFDRIWASQVAILGQEAALARLPVDAAGARNIQDQSTGAMHFMVDMDPIDGDNPIQ